MPKEIKKKKKSKGFTLIEMLVAVLILAILVAIALPTYNRAVERSRTSDPINTLKTIAKAEQVQKLRTGEYTNDVPKLDLQLTDYPAGNIVANDSFDGQYYAYKIYGNEEAVATAARKGVNEGEDDFYELSIDYNTGELFCRPSTNKTCIDLGLEEGQYYGAPKWETCAGKLDDIFINSFGVSGSQETKINSCELRVDKRSGITDFKFCPNGAEVGISFHANVTSFTRACVTGKIYDNKKLVYCEGDCTRQQVYENYDDGSYLNYDCSVDRGKCGFVRIWLHNDRGNLTDSAYCYYGNVNRTDNTCNSYYCRVGDCAALDGLEFEWLLD